MRTTVTLDADVPALLKRARREQDRSFKETLNDAVRAGLRKPAAAAKAPRFVQRSFKMGRPLVDLSKANALAGELEDTELAARTQRRRRGGA
ncbi:MAG TPA: hypothetical protein PKB14_13840 [Rubrivivax sp.]|nr:hypothetical protein [Rubrivivax sp.]